MAKKSPADMTAAYLRGMAGAGQRYTAGTGQVTESPMAKAAANLDKAAAAYQEAVSSGRMAQALQSVPLATWKAACAAGAQRLASGAQKGQAKYQAEMQRLAPVHAAMKQASMSAGDDPIAKVSAALAVLLAAKKNS